MLKWARSTASYTAQYTHSYFWLSFAAHSPGRYLSTNSAISKGLRKSKKGRSNLDPPTRFGTAFTERADTGKQFEDTRYGTSKIKNHSRSGDDDEETPEAFGKGVRTLRERRILKRKEGKPVQNDYQRSSNSQERSGRLSSRLSSSIRGQNSGRNLGVKEVQASRTNRAERRATHFGHRENPPEGYKALQAKVGNQQRSPHRASVGDGAESPGHQSTSSRMKYKDRSTMTRLTSEDSWTAPQPRKEGQDSSGERFNLSSDERPRRKSNAPLAIPYTTPASEFLYGHSVVTTALKASRRTFYKLYLYDGDTAEVRGQDRQVRKLALAANIEVTRVGSDWLRLMDKMSGGRPHNGYILEASPLPKLPVTALQPIPNPQPSFRVALNHQSQEEEAINGNNTSVQYGTGYRRYPFLLLLDGIRDPGNMGAILRSAHFLGVDGIIICNRNSAPMSPVTLKAAAGAAESLPIFSVDQPISFIDKSQEYGWKFYAAVSPSSSDSEKVPGRPFYLTSTMDDPPQRHPCVLILGSEGEGLRWNIQKKADYLVGIESQRSGSGDLDSLNVSVAAALLCHAFLKGPTMKGDVKDMRQGRLVSTGIDGSTMGDTDSQRLF